MLEPINWKGYFHTPNNPSEQLPGILKFSQDEGINLELFGQFEGYHNPASREENILLGFTSNGKHVTLLSCHEYTRGMNLPGFPTSSFSANYLLVGKQYQKPEDIIFEECIIDYKDLIYWLNISGFDNPVFNKEQKEAIIRYVQPEKRTFSIKENWALTFDFQYRRPWEYFVPLESASITQEPAVVIRPTAPAHLHQFGDIYATFNSMLAMGFYTYPHMQSITFNNKLEPEEDEVIQIEGQEEEVTIHGEKFRDENIQLYFKTGLPYKSYKAHHHRSNFLFRFKTYESQFHLLISNWYVLNDKIDVSINALSEWFMDRSNTVESNFTHLTQGLENMHRKLYGGNKTFIERINFIIDALPLRVRNSILSNETDFARRVTNNRNYYTHFDVRGEFVPASLSEVWLITQKLRLILLAAILQQTGFTNEQVEMMILKKGMYLFNHIIDTSGMEDYLREVNSKED